MRAGLDELSPWPVSGHAQGEDPLRTLPSVVRRWLGLTELEQIYSRIVLREDGAFARLALNALDISWSIPFGDLQNVPCSGPVVVLANHPFGGLDALVLLDLISRVRDDTRVLANHYLGGIGALRDRLLLVDPFGGRGAAGRNAPALRAALRWLEQGGSLLAFPAGEVASYRLSRARVVEPTWSSVPLRLARRAEAQVIPSFVAGSNSPLFQVAGTIHPRLRTCLLPRELLRSSSRHVHVRIGAPVDAAFPEPSEGTARLRRSVLALGNAVVTRHVRHAPLAAREPGTRISEEVEALPASSVLVSRGDWRVLAFRAHEAPAALREVGRLRERSFRGVGEGTGRREDLDVFDQTYRQLILWNVARRTIAGGYRLAAVNEVLSERGPAGLYTSTLFAYAPEFFRGLGAGAELGRSFVCPEYQRMSLPLTLLWRGIGALVLELRCSRLLGAVSVSARYSVRARSLMTAFLSERRMDATLASNVRPRHPVEVAGCRIPRTAVDLHALLRRPENGRRGMPVLLRHYLKLGAVFVGANVDPDFSDAMDVLLVVDLGRLPHTVRQRYLGANANDER